jgi:hypothetical protein
LELVLIGGLRPYIAPQRNLLVALWFFNRTTMGAVGGFGMDFQPDRP